ncbi:pyridoxine 5'-phosphate synthase [Celerinatantimonas yamalensis]|uniref:Pyridoxine 5'-phosphate synthase n=1 Tax=Celerinatantimonas yamalensis TaxID=559956 RepID=A0ABW9G8B0_9GAMM
MKDIYLGVNIDHIATLRQARGTRFPDPVYAAGIAESSGADGITIHLREDRRHIQDRDLQLLSQTVQTRLNLEMAVTDAMVAKACEYKPQFVCLVPENRQELTTEGGLNVVAAKEKITAAIAQLSEAGIVVSLFIDTDREQIQAARECAAPFIELHTGHYADAPTPEKQYAELQKITAAASFAQSLGLTVNAGHGLHYHNVAPIAAIPEIYELNIGHAIIAQATFSGLSNAVSDMKKLMQQARSY